MLYYVDISSVSHRHSFIGSSQEINSCPISIIFFSQYALTLHRDLDMILLRWKIQVRVSTSDKMHVFHCMPRMTIGWKEVYI